MSIKKPLHPGKILHNILSCEGWILPAEIQQSAIKQWSSYYNIDAEKIEHLLNSAIDIDYVIAYKLGKAIQGTDMSLWLKLQEDYDEYEEKNCYKKD